MHRDERLLHYLLGEVGVLNQQGSHAQERPVVYRIELGDRMIGAPCAAHWYHHSGARQGSGSAGRTLCPVLGRTARNAIRGQCRGPAELFLGQQPQVSLGPFTVHVLSVPSPMPAGLPRGPGPLGWSYAYSLSVTAESAGPGVLVGIRQR